MRVLQIKALHDLQQIKPCKASKIDNPKKIIVHSVHGQYLGAIYRELAIAKTLQLKGHNVKIIFCGGTLKQCTGCFTNDNPPNEGQCENCINFSKKFAETVGLPYATYDDYLEEDIYRSLKTRFVKNGYYKDVNVESHAQKSVDRYYKGEQPTNIYYNSKLQDTIIVVDVAEQILKEEKPDIILTSHSIYAEWGSFSEFFKNHKIPVYTWYTGTVPDTLVFNFDQIGKDFETYWKDVRKKQFLNSKEYLELGTFLDKRRKGYGDTALYTYTQKKKNLNFSQYQKIVALFPNVPWDIDTTNRTLFFDSTYEWIDFTVKLFEERPEWLLIIKTHPYERIEKSKKSVYDYVTEKYNLPNLLPIPADTEISSYDLFSDLDVGIVSNSTTGIEMLLEGVPVITVGEAHYRGKGFTNDPTTKEEYIELLMNKNLPKNNSGDLAMVYAYYYFIKSYVPFDVFRKKNFLKMGWNINSYDEFLKNKTSNHIADCILENKIFQDW
jgi:hypothetical protein